MGVSWKDRRLKATGLRRYRCTQMNWGESIVGMRSLNTIEVINDYFHLNLFEAQCCRPLGVAENR
jgi:hypothetical protein